MADIFELFRKIEKKKSSPTGPVEYIVAGLGNPGAEYINSRHNAGFAAVDFICKKYDAECTKAKFHALCGECEIGGRRVLLLKPQTYMNNSGIAVREASEFYKIPPEKLIVIYDDINFDPGRMRIREKGSDGGHNGMKSIIYHLSSDLFPRIRVGVGRKPSPETDLASWVLGDIKGEDREKYISALENVPSAVELIIKGAFQEAMGRFN